MATDHRCPHCQTAFPPGQPLPEQCPACQKALTASGAGAWWLGTPAPEKLAEPPVPSSSWQTVPDRPALPSALKEIPVAAPPLPPASREAASLIPQPAPNGTAEERPIANDLDPATPQAAPGVLLGSVALGLGALGFAAGWSPPLALVGVVLAGLGFVLGACVLLWALPHGAAASGFPMAGAAVSLQGLIVAVVLLWAPRTTVHVENIPGDGDDNKKPPPVLVDVKLGEVLPLLKRETLSKSLHDPDQPLRRETALVLGEIAGRLGDAVADLTSTLEDKEPSVRSAAAEALGRLGPAARGAYLALVHVSRNDGDAGVRQAARLASDRVGMPGPGDVPLLCQALKDPNPDFRAAAAQTLAMVGPAAGEARITLREGLEDADARVRVYCGQTLWVLLQQPAVVLPVFKEALTDKKDAGVRATAAYGLGLMAKHAEPASAELKDALRDDDALVRFHAAQALWVVQGQAAAVVPTLIKLLSDKDLDSSIRALSAEVLARIGKDAKAAVKDLIAILQTDEPAVRGRAAFALGAIGPDAREAVPALIEALAAGPELQQQAVHALRGIGPNARAAVPALRKLLLGSAPDLQARLAHALEAIGADAGEAVPDLTKLLTSREATVRLRAAQALWKIAGRTEDTVPVLLEILEHKDHRFRLAAVKALGTIGHPAVVASAALADLRDDVREHDEVRGAADTALEKIGLPDKDDVASLIKGLKHANLRYRLESARSLGLVGADAKSAVEPLTAAIKDTDDRIRIAAVLSLKEIGPEAKKAVPALAKALPEASKELRAAILVTLAGLGRDAKEALPALLKLLNEKNIAQQVQILDAVGEMREEAKAAVKDLIALVKDENKEIRSNAAIALANIGEAAKEALPALKAALTDRDANVRLFAAQAVKAIGNLKRLAIPVLAKLLDDDDPGVCAAAAEVLGDIGPDVREIDRKVTTKLVEMLRHRDAKVKQAADAALKKIDPKGPRP